MVRKSTPNPIDVHVGKRLRQRRNVLGMSQEKLADQLGITFQQVQKYERGTNRVGASRLFQIGRALGVPTSHFFEGYSGQGLSGEVIAEDTQKISSDVMESRETIELIKAYYAITNPKVRKKMLEMLKSWNDKDKSGE